MDNLEKLNKINNLLDIFTNVEELKEYIDVLISIEEEYQDEIMGDTCRNGKSWDKCDCC
jgi:hypothetical protein